MNLLKVRHFVFVLHSTEGSFGVAKGSSANTQHQNDVGRFPLGSFAIGGTPFPWITMWCSCSRTLQFKSKV